METNQYGKKEAFLNIFLGKQESENKITFMPHGQRSLLLTQIEGSSCTFCKTQPQNFELK